MPRQHGHLRFKGAKGEDICWHQFPARRQVIQVLPQDAADKKKCLFILLTAAFCDPFPKTTSVYFYFLKVNTCHPPAVFWGSDDLWAQSMPSARVWVTSVSWSRCGGGGSSL